MAVPSSEEDGLLREWAPLTDLLQQIPLRAQRGLFTHNLSLTCVDTLPEFIAVGTNLGLVYWYNRKKGDLQRLRCENTGSAITCVKVISTVDFMVAAGNDEGIVTVFQIPKILPDSLPESIKPKKNKQVERYTISGLHTSPVTAIEWSMNGMKMFSGDKSGLVVLTEIDFYMHLSKSVELLNEKYEIVQLSYSQQLLIVSTLYRSIVCCHREDHWKVAQVGQKERKVLGRLGATFCLGSGRPQELVVYASRPGLRVWLADKNGVVQQTLIYKDALMKDNTHTPLINPASPHVKQVRCDHQFGPLLVFREHLLVTHSSDMVYILNPATISVVATVADLRGVLDVAVNKDEIFILEGERSLIRVAYTPESIVSLAQESHGMNLRAASSSTEVLVHVIGSSEVQSMLADKMLPKKAVWDHIAAEMKSVGFDMGERGADRCRQKWAKAVRNYFHFSRTRAFNMKACYPLYYDGVEAILNQKKRVKDAYAPKAKPLVNACVTPDVFQQKQDDECSEDADGHSPLSPKQICQKDDSVRFSSSDIPLSSNSSEDDTSEVFKTIPENCVFNSSIPADKRASKSVSDQSNDEEIVLVYPGGMKLSSGSKFVCESEIPVGDVDSEVCVTLYPDDVSDDILHNSLPKLINYQYAEDILSKCNEQSSHHSDSRKAMDVGNVNLSLPDLESMNKPSLAPKTSSISDHGSPTIIVSPKPNQPSRPIPTAGEAMMSLVRRLYDKERRTEKGRVRRREARIHGLEVLLKEQSVRQQEMLNTAILAIRQLE